MIETHLNVFDMVVIGIMVLSCLFAFFRGLVREILSLAAWIGAGVVTIYYYPAVSEKLQMHFKSHVVANTISIAGIYLAALILFGLVNMVIIKTFKRGSEAGMLDNLLGLFFGAFRGALIISLAFFLLSVALPEKEYPDWLKTSVTRPYAEQGAIALAKVAPEYLREISSLQKRATDEIRASNVQDSKPAAGSDEDDDSKDQGTGYSKNTTRQLDRLIQSTKTDKE